MKKLIRLAALVLSAALLMGVLASCGASNGNVTTTVEETETDPEGYRNGYLIIEVDSELEVQTNFTSTVEKFATRHPYAEHQGEIIFYGASNFARWANMENDMAEYKVMNHAFGGSTDVDLIYFSNYALFPYNPSIVFFQTGSNDYVNIEGTDEEKVAKCMAVKKTMFEAFHEQMPDAVFVVMSGLLLPGRSEYLEITQQVNEQLKQMAEDYDYIYYVDSSDMTWDGTSFAEDLFVEDGIHLNDEGRAIWYKDYIKPEIEMLIDTLGLESVRNK